MKNGRPICFNKIILKSDFISFTSTKRNAYECNHSQIQFCLEFLLRKAGEGSGYLLNLFVA